MPHQMGIPGKRNRLPEGMPNTIAGTDVHPEERIRGVPGSVTFNSNQRPTKDNRNFQRFILEPNLPIRTVEDTALSQDNTTTWEAQERRTHLRFPLLTELRYQIHRRGPGEQIRGTGRVENISSKGLAFHTETPLQPGMRLSVSMAWPAKLDNQCLLRLQFQGTVLRKHASLVVLTLEHPEFRTAGKSTEPARQEMAALASSIDALMASPVGGRATSRTSPLQIRG